MIVRADIERRYVLEDKPVIIRLLNNPVIDDILVVEARIQAYFIETGNSDPNRRVTRDIRDYLIRLGVEK